MLARRYSTSGVCVGLAGSHVATSGVSVGLAGSHVATGGVVVCPLIE